jgi:hypothetical protein
MTFDPDFENNNNLNVEYAYDVGTGNGEQRDRRTKITCLPMMQKQKVETTLGRSAL